MCSFRLMSKSMTLKDLKLKLEMCIVELSRSTSAPITFLLVDQSSPIFFVKRGSGGGQSSLFPVVDLLIHSGDMATKV